LVIGSENQFLVVAQYGIMVGKKRNKVKAEAIRRKKLEALNRRLSSIRTILAGMNYRHRNVSEWTVAEKSKVAELYLEAKKLKAELKNLNLNRKKKKPKRKFRIPKRAGGVGVYGLGNNIKRWR
jgi:hypothetical protein